MKVSEAAMAQVFDRERQGPRLAGSAWGTVSYWLALVATFIAGMWVSSMYRGGPLLQDSALLFVALATLSLGFGTGILIYHLRQRSEQEWLRAEYEALSTRADALVNAAEQLERRPPPGR